MADRVWERIAFCPDPPLLITGMGGLTPVAELAQVAAAAKAAVRWLVDGARSLAVVGAGSSSRRYPSGHLATTRRFGPELLLQLGSGSRTSPPDPTVPLSLLVAASLLCTTDLAMSSWSVRPAAGSDDVTRIVGDTALADSGRLLVMGDGSVRRGAAESMQLDVRPGDVDDRMADLLATGSAEGLAALNAAAAPPLDAVGVGPWQVAAEVAGAAPPRQAELDAYAAPFGVAYFVARWSSR